jgi:predicted membrane-bound spermidine synthase
VRISLLFILLASGACSLAYQSTWLRELRLVFGASTPATSAVLCMFMGGLGLGGLLLGRRVERSERPLRFYAWIELSVAFTAALSPLVLSFCRSVYLAAGGQRALGDLGATVVRLGLAAIVVGVPAFLMGGTLPAAARAFRGDEGRRFVGALYGVNTLGAVLGAFVPAFFLFEALGHRRTLWLFCALNVVLAAAALALSLRPLDDEPAAPEPDARARVLDPFVLGAAFMTGFVFFFAELLWYRLGTPILGGSTYTFALILTLALLGIGLGAAWFARVPRPPTWGRFALSCAVAGVVLAAPLVLGDDVARMAEVLRDLETNGFWGLVFGWTVVAAILVLPLSLVAGYQFPLLLALARRGTGQVAADVGAVYGANTAGAIVGSLAGGFGLIPLLGAELGWRLAAVALVGLALIAALRAGAGARALAALVATLGLGFAIAGPGPGVLWRHGGIGAGRSAPPATRLDDDRRRARVELRTVDPRDGREASTAVVHGGGPAFSVGGKTDGNARLDSMTQVGSAILPALLHGEPRTGFIVGLGTGQTAGWLASLPSVERVEVAEIEPDILDFARLVEDTNHRVVDHEKVTILIGDGRELLLTSRASYDVIISEPSNPYRAGVASFYTADFYRAVNARLSDGGVFAQWMQGYEIEPAAIALVLSTLRQVFEHVSVWHLGAGDMLFVATPGSDLDSARMEELLEHPAYRLAMRRPFGLPPTLEGVASRLIATPRFVDGVIERLPGWVNTDDHPILEYSFARSVGDTGQNALASFLRTALSDTARPTLTAYRHRSFTHREVRAPPLIPDDESEMNRAVSVADFGRARQLAHKLEIHPDDESLLSRAGELLASSKVPEHQAKAAWIITRLDAIGARADAALIGLVLAFEHEPARVASLASTWAELLRADPWAAAGGSRRMLNRLSYAFPGSDDDAHNLANALAKSPFAGRQFEVERVTIGRALASRGDPDPICVALEDELEGQVHLDEAELEARARCFGKHAPARADDVTEALDELRARLPRGFGDYGPRVEINPVTNPSE